MITKRPWIVGFLGVLSLSLTACGTQEPPIPGPSTFEVVITAVDTLPPPEPDNPLPANRGDLIESWDFTIQALDGAGNEESFDGVVRLSIRPGTVLGVEGEGALGRNITLVGGKAAGRAKVIAMYGPTRLWAEDLGYFPAPEGTKPKCSDGIDNDGDALIDFPADPGCAFADDDTEEEGTHAAGASLPVAYQLPKISDLQGNGTTTPYPFEAIQALTDAPADLIVTRVASDGFYVTDLNDQANGYNHMFAFNFSTPPGMRICDRVTYLSGTVTEFFGFTELSFPSYDLSFPLEGMATCDVPEPIVLDAATINDPVAMEKLESGLVRVENAVIAANFGPDLVVNNVPHENSSSCDLNGDGAVDFESAEGSCSNVCDDPTSKCSEWTSFSARGAYTVFVGSTPIRIQTGAISTFDPVANRGKTITSVTGTLRNFSGGSLNWTIEARCPDDLACSLPGCGTLTPKPSTEACVRLRTVDDPDEGTN